MPMSLRFLGYVVNENELLTQEIIDTWEQVFKENNGTITPVESTGDNLFYFKDSALGENWVLGWVLDAEKNLFQFGPVTKPFPLVANASTFRERFGIKIEKIEKPVIEVSFEYTPNKEDLEKEEVDFKEAKVQRAGQGTDDLGRPFTEFKDEAGNVVLRLTLVEEKKEEVEKVEPIYDYTPNKDDFANAKDYKFNNETFNLSEEGNDVAGKPFKKFTDELGRVRVVLALVEPKEEEKPKEAVEEKKEEVVNEYTSDEKVFFDSQEWGAPSATLKRAEEGKDELGRPFVNFRDETGAIKLILTLTEGKPAEEVKEEPVKENEAPKVERISIEVNGVQITKVDGQELPERKSELTPEEEAALKIANEYQENLKERTWDELANGRVLVTDYLYSEHIKVWDKDGKDKEERVSVRVQVVFVDTAAKTLSGYTIDADNKSSRVTAKTVDALIEETVKNILGTEKEADAVPTEDRAEVTE